MDITHAVELTSRAAVTTGISLLICISTATAQFTWELKTPLVSPPARSAASLAHDLQRGITVLFGGSQSGGSQLRDTWEWDGTTWIDKSTALSPPAMLGQSLAYDSARNVVVAIGGNPVEIWEWNGSSWVHRLTPMLPTLAVYGAAYWMPNYTCFDSARGCTVFLRNQLSVAPPALFEWDGLTWTQRADPPGIVVNGACFDPTRATTVARLMSETAEWDGQAWSSRPGTAPFGLLVYEGHLGLPTNYASGLSASGTMAWTGLEWIPYPSQGIVPIRYLPALTWDATNSATVLFGGSASVGTTTMSVAETWIRSSTAGTFLHGVASSYGVGCGSPTPVFEAANRPVVGSSFETIVRDASLGIAFVAWGLDNTSWGGASIPISLEPIGLHGCQLWQSGDIRIDAPCIPTGLTTAEHAFQIPIEHSLVGVHVYGQAWTIQPLFNPLGLVLSNGLDVMIGNL